MIRVLGHRGASAYAPENTLAAFRGALDLGADGVELDVTLSADGRVVVIHDDTLDRTTDGAGPVRALTLAELKRLDAGYRDRFGSQFAGERLPTLDEVLAAFGEQPYYNIELKRDRSSGRPLAERVVALVHAHGLAGRVILSSFQWSSLRLVRQVDPQLPIGALYTLAAFAPLAERRLEPLHPDAVHPEHHLLTPERVAWQHARGRQVNTWTVDAPDDLARVFAAGVDGVITNRPDVALVHRGGNKLVV